MYYTWNCFRIQPTYRLDIPSTLKDEVLRRFFDKRNPLYLLQTLNLSFSLNSYHSPLSFYFYGTNLLFFLPHIKLYSYYVLFASIPWGFYTIGCRRKIYDIACDTCDSLTSFKAGNNSL